MAVAVLAILLSLTVMPLKIDHSVLATQSGVVAAQGVAVADNASIQSTAHTICHVGHACIFGIMPGSQIASARLDDLPELPAVAGHKPSVAGYMPFHPPRMLSPV